jgi:hypothetical protein
MKETQKALSKKDIDMGLQEIVEVRETDYNKYDKYPHSDITQKIIG